MNTELLYQSFEVMGKGMLAIFIVSIAIYAVVQVLAYLNKKIPEKGGER